METSATPIARLTRRPDAATAVIAGVGVVGAVLVARASYVVGTLPGRLERSVAYGGSRWEYEAGVALLVLAWLALGRLVLDPTVAGMTRRVCWAGAAMGAPLLAAAPVTSQDVWAYLGQANVAAHGLDPYTLGPSAAPGPIAHSVAHAWVNVGSPYGPLWVWICRIVVDVTGEHPWAGMFVLRLVAVAATAALALALVHLCRATGRRPEVALWLAVAGPFPLLALLGALHNESVMLALLVAGVAVAARLRSPWHAILFAAVLVGLAAAIKITAVAALPFLPLVWHRYVATREEADLQPMPLRAWVSTGTASIATGLLTVLMSGVLTGFGVGWIGQAGDGKVGIRWLSVPQQIANVLHLFAPDQVAGTQLARYSVVHPIGVVLMVGGLAAVTLTARSRPPLVTIALALLVPVLTSPAPRAWYLLWPLMIVAAGRIGSRPLVLMVAAQATIAVWYPPDVLPSPPEWLLVVLFVPLAALAAAASRSRPLPELVGVGKAG